MWNICESRLQTWSSPAKWNHNKKDLLLRDLVLWFRTNCCALPVFSAAKDNCEIGFYWSSWIGLHHSIPAQGWNLLHFITCAWWKCDSRCWRMWLTSKQTNVLFCLSVVDVIEIHGTSWLRVEIRVDFPCGLPLLLGQVLANVVPFEGQKNLRWVSSFTKGKKKKTCERQATVS